MPDGGTSQRHSQGPELINILKESLGSASKEPTAEEYRVPEPPESELEDDVPPPPHPKPSAFQRQPRPLDEQEWLTKSRHSIRNRTVPLTTPFKTVSEQTLKRLEEAENTRGGLKQALAKVLEIAHEIARQTKRKQAVKVLGSDSEEERSDTEGDSGGPSQSPTVLECTRRAMVLEERIKLITSSTMEVLDPVDASHKPTSGFETDSDDSEFGTDAGESEVVADYERMKARGNGGEQDSGKILLCQTYLAYPRKLPHTPARKMRIRSTKRGMVTTRQAVCWVIHWSFIHV